MEIKDIQREIEMVISEVKSEYADLVDTMTCKNYASEIFYRLKSRGIRGHIVDTENDLGMDYEHWFLLVFKEDDDNYLIDLTYGQFGYYPQFSELYENGYQEITDDEMEDYLRNIKEVTKKRVK